MALEMSAVIKKNQFRKVAHTSNLIYEYSIPKLLVSEESLIVISILFSMLLTDHH